MADLNDPLPGAGVSFWTMAAAAAGALLTLRTLVESSPWARGIAVISAFSLGFFAAPALVELLGYKPGGNVERGLALVVAFIGVNVLAGVATFGEKWRQDPQAAVGWAWSLWRGTPK